MAVDFDTHEDTGINWRAPDGYGAGISRMTPLAVLRLGLRVDRIDRSGPTLRLANSLGELLSRALVVCVSSAILAREDLAFTPRLPDKVQAASDLPLGLAN